MANLTNKNIEFLSDRELINILRSILEEIDAVASLGAHRSTTYLAVSAIEGLFGEILKLKRIDSSTVPQFWPKKDGKFIARNQLSLNEREIVLQEAKALQPDFESLYKPLRDYRNYIHPELEKNQTPITQSVGQRALASLNTLIEQYESLRFITHQEWSLKYGIAQVPADNVIHMPQNNGDPVSLIVCELSAQNFQEMTFRVRIPPDAIFNFIYNFSSLDKFMGARIEGRIGWNGQGLHDGRLVCKKWRKWDISGRYTKESSPSPQKLDHIVKIVLNPPTNFSITVDGIQLELESRVHWGFRPKEKIGFMTEWGDVSILDLKVQTI